jgi:hypothetical protein
MKKIALLLLVAAVAASPAAADTKKKATKMTADNAQKSNPNDASWRLVRDGAPLVLPWWSLPVYFNVVHKEPDKKQ